jgi:putative ABC transport system substrate-binding protein
MRRREFIKLICGAAAWPLTARAQQPALPVIGFLNHGLPDEERVRAFRQGLGEAGFVEGRNVVIEFRWANNQVPRLPELAADLVQRRVAVIVAAISTPGALAAKAATTTIPIVFGVGTDPVEASLVLSLNRPGSNVTGVAIRNVEINAKRLGLLHELSPGTDGFAALLNPNVGEIAEPFAKDVEAGALSIGRNVHFLHVRSSRDIDSAFAKAAEMRSRGVLIAPDLMLNNRRVQLVTLAARHAIATMYPWREAVEIGGLISYGPSFADVLRQVGAYTGRILKGEKPADLPVMLPTKFELVINVQTARIIGLDIPPTLLARADEVIE